jgi:hypothetical protein
MGAAEIRTFSGMSLSRKSENAAELSGCAGIGYICSRNYPGVSELRDMEEFRVGARIGDILRNYAGYSPHDRFAVKSQLDRVVHVA